MEQLFEHGAAECVAELMHDVAPGDWDLAFALALTRTGMQMRSTIERTDAALPKHLDIAIFDMIFDACIEQWGRAGWACRFAAARGHLALLQLLDGERGRCQRGGQDSVFRAAVHGHADCLRYLVVGSGCPWSTKDTLLGAAVGGDLECLRFVLMMIMDGSLLLAEGTTATTAYTAATACGHLPAMQLILAHSTAAGGSVDPHPALIYAAMNGHADCVRFLLQEHAHVFARDTDMLWRTDRLADMAIVGGHLDCARLLGQLRPWRARTLCSAAAHRHVECVRYLLETGCPVEMPHVLESALRGGSVDCVQLILDAVGPARRRGGVTTRSGSSTSLPPMSECACCNAASVDCLRFVHERGARVCGKCVKSALDNPDKLRYLLQTAGATTEDPQDYYAAACNIESLRLLHDTAGLRWVEPRGGKKQSRYVSRTKTGANVCEHIATGGGSEECLAYVHDVVGCQMSEYMILFSMDYNMKSYACMQTALERGCPLSTACTERAASVGNLGALRWLREHGCPWTRRACLAAARRGHVLCLRYAVERGCPWDPVECSAAAQAARNRDAVGAAECLSYIAGIIASSPHRRSTRIAAAAAAR